MFRIGIIGSDNSHADAFSKLLNIGLDPKDEQAKYLMGNTPIPEGSGNVFPYPDYKVTALFGTDPERNRQVAEVGNIPLVVDNPEDMMGKVDGVMVVWRHGNLHMQYAMPFIKAGMPVWIDKPFTIRPEETQEIFAEAAKSGSIVCGGTTTKYLPGIRKMKQRVAEAGKYFKGGSMCYAATLANEYGGIFFYGQHLVECALEVFGYGVQSVYASARGENVSVILRYADKNCVLNFITDNYDFRVLLYIDREAEYADIPISGSYSYGFAAFKDAIEGKGPALKYENMFEAVELLWSIDESFRSGREVILRRS